MYKAQVIMLALLLNSIFRVATQKAETFNAML